MVTSFHIGCLPNRPRWDCLRMGRFKVLAGMGIEGFVWLAGISNPYPYLETFAREVIPQVIGSAPAALAHPA